MLPPLVHRILLWYWISQSIYEKPDKCLMKNRDFSKKLNVQAMIMIKQIILFILFIYWNTYKLNGIWISSDRNTEIEGAQIS